MLVENAEAERSSSIQNLGKKAGLGQNGNYHVWRSGSDMCQIRAMLDRGVCDVFGEMLEEKTSSKVLGGGQSGYSIGVS